MTKFVEPLVERSPGFTDVHQEIFASRADAVKAGYSGDFSEVFFGSSERYPRGPWQGAPGGGEIIGIIAVFCGGFLLVGIRRHA
jgi:hypothetical protein